MVEQGIEGGVFGYIFMSRRFVTCEEGLIFEGWI